VSTLHRIHAIKKRGPKASSLFFHEILSGSERFPNGEGFIGDKLQNPAKSADDRLSSAIKDSGVLRHEWTAWHWDMVLLVFQCEAFIRNAEVSAHKTFLRKIFEFYKPSKGLFSKVELSHPHSKELGWIGLAFLDLLLKIGGGLNEGSKILDELLADIHYYIKAVISSESPHDCLISPTRIATTASQYYFLFLGHLSRSESGRNLLLRHAFLP
ncbi:Rapamycininsensitive companion of mTORlike, partial [Caligus rogercresseyi]